MNLLLSGILEGNKELHLNFMVICKKTFYFLSLLSAAVNTVIDLWQSWQKVEENGVTHSSIDSM